MKYGKNEREEALKRLREWIKPGDTVYTVLRNVSRSGMQREIGVVLLKDDAAGPIHPNRSVSIVLGLREGKRDGVIIGGCGMNMGFDIVYNLGVTLFGRGDECAKNKYKTGRNGNKGYETDGGYLLKHRWL